MTMTAREEKVLRRWANSTNAVGTIFEAVATLASVALKEAAIKAAQAEPEAIEAMREAASELLKLLDEAMPHIESAIQIATIHSCPYRGPRLDIAADKLRAALGQEKEK